MWAGRFAKSLDTKADDFNSSIRFDCKMYKQDIIGSMAHAEMLSKQNIITKADYVDEFLQFDATPEKISNAICEILDNNRKREHILEGCRKTKELLGKTHCVNEVAKVIKKELIGE